MNIDLNEIFDFFETRIKCHVESVNYFAGLLGYHFPEHDRDKIVEPMRTGYAYIFYGKYHKNVHLLPQQFELCHEAKLLHHDHSAHHIEHYKQVREIPDVRLYEMVSDWASANFENMDVLGTPDAVPLTQWFDKNMSDFCWSEHQLEIIEKSFEIFESKTDKNKLLDIWKPLVEKSDL